MEGQSFAVPIDPVNAKNSDIGTGTKLYHSPDVLAKMTMDDGSRINADPARVLQHELIHADNNRTGKQASLENLNGVRSQEELNVRTRENIMNIIKRKE